MHRRIAAADRTVAVLVAARLIAILLLGLLDRRCNLVAGRPPGIRASGTGAAY